MKEWLTENKEHIKRGFRFLGLCVCGATAFIGFLFLLSITFPYSLVLLVFALVFGIGFQDSKGNL